MSWFDRNYGLIVWGLIIIPPIIAVAVTVVLIII